MMPSLSNFKVLCVLAMENCTFMGNGSWNLENLGMLLQLRFLGLRSTPVSQLPKEIGNLMLLQTLDLKYTDIIELPQSVGLLRQLKCLYIDYGVSDWIGHLTSLQELQFSKFKMSPNFLKELGKMTQLRVLRLSMYRLEGTCQRVLVESLGKLHIQFLEISYNNNEESFDEAAWEGFVPPRELVELVLRKGFRRMPAWI